MTPVSENVMIESAREQGEASGGLTLARLRETLHGASGGAWVREASLTLALAAQARVALSEEGLLLCDVRDLMSAQQAIRSLAADERSTHAMRALRDLSLV